MRNLVVVAVLVLSAFCIHGSYTIVVEKELQTTHVLTRFELFGFRKGGTIDISLSVSTSNAYLLICTETEYRQLIASYPTETDVCANRYDTFDCFDYQPVLNETTLEYHNEVDESATYLFYVLTNCASSNEAEIKLEYTLLNPGGQHLSTSEIPLQTICALFFALWCIMLLAWGGNWWLNRDQKILLHRFVTLIPLLKCIFLVYRVYYWNHYSTVGKITIFEIIIYYAVYSIFHAVLFLSFLVISKGWCLTRATLMKPERHAIAITAFALAFTILFWRLLRSFYLFALVIMYIITFKYVFVGVQYQLSMLKTQLLLIRDYGINPRTTPVFQKFRIFKTFQICMFGYVGFSALCIVLNVFFFQNWLWVEVLMEELIVVAVALPLGYELRLRKFTHPCAVDDPASVELSEFQDPLPSLLFVAFPSMSTSKKSLPLLSFGVQEGREHLWKLDPQIEEDVLPRDIL